MKCFGGLTSRLSPLAVSIVSVAALVSIPVGEIKAGVNILTYHSNYARTGANLSETVLTPANVNSTTFGKLFSYTVDGHVYAQPLYVSGLTIPDKGTHNVLFIATQHNSVYAFDADSPTGSGGLLWKVNLGPSATTPNNDFGNRFGPYDNINPEVGITGTPVIDLASQTLYVNAFTNEGTSYFHRLHALSIVDGTERTGSPVMVTASVAGTGIDNSTGQVVFNAKQQLQRSGLAIVDNILYVCYASYADTDPFHGWIIGFDKTTLHQLPAYTFNTTPNGSEGGIWSGGAMAIDEAGHLFVTTGNGTFNGHADGGKNYGNTLLKLSTNGGLAVADFFTPYNQASLDMDDIDLGSGGAILLPEQPGPHPHLLVFGSKEGKIYLVDRDQLTSNNMHYNAGGSVDSIVQSISGATGRCFDTPAYFNGRVYFAGFNNFLKAFSLSDGLLSTSAVSTSTRKFGFPGAVPMISANGSDDGIVWVLQRANSTPAVLIAYDATDLSTELYNSTEAANNRDQMPNPIKFFVPVIANGKVYVAGQSAVAVLGLNPPAPNPTPPPTPTPSPTPPPTPTPTPVSFAGWQAMHFTDAQRNNASVSGWDADPDFDGLSNAFEFYFNFDPTSPLSSIETSQLPHLAIQTINEHNYLTFVYRRLIGSGGIPVKVGISNDLLIWDETETEVETVGDPVPTGDEVTETVTVRCKTPIDQGQLVRKFFRLRLAFVHPAGATQWKLSEGGNDHWYEVIQTAFPNWRSARDYAIDQGGHLATVTSSAENNFIRRIFANASPVLGGYTENGEWHWVTGEPFTFTSWDSGEPNNFGGVEDCLQLLIPAGSWNDTASSYSSICVIEYSQ